jgi:hypothetical protein
MTKYILFGSLVAVTALLAVQEKTVVKNKPEYPKVILNSTNYSSITTSECPRDLPRFIETGYVDSAGQTPEMAKHCQKCSIGVYSLHENEQVKKCTWCGDKDKSE